MPSEILFLKPDLMVPLYPLQIPGFFQKNPEHRTHFLDDLILVEYRTYRDTERIPVEVDGLLFVYVISGRKILTTDEARLTLESGEGILIAAGSYLMGEQREAEGKPYESLLVFYREGLLESIARDCQIRKSEEASPGAAPIPLKSEKTGRLFQEMIPAIKEILFDPPSGGPTILSLKARELLLRLEGTDRGPKIRALLARFTEKSRPDLRRYMLEHYTDPGNAGDFSRRTLRTPASFNREFRNLFGESPARWLTRKRLEKAAVLLKSSELNVTEIALRVGYETTGRFIEMFRRRYGQSPGRFRTTQPTEKSIN